MSYPEELLADDLLGLRQQAAPRSGFAALGELLAGPDVDGAFLKGQLQSAKTTEAINRARMVRDQQAARERVQDLNLSDPNLRINDLVLGGLGTDFASAAQGRLRTQEFANRNVLGDELAPPLKRQAASDAVEGRFTPYRPVGSDAYYKTTEPEAGVLAVPAPLGSNASAKRTPVGYRYKPDGNLEYIPGGPADPKGPRAATVTRAPAGYRYRADGGGLEYIPGGPADPKGPNAARAVQQLRKEFRSLQTVKDYQTVLPLIESAYNAPDDGFGDLELIYTAGKVFDPGSVVREGELALTIKAGSPIERLIGTARFYIGGGGRLTPETRAQLVNTLETRREAIQQQYQLDYDTYADYAIQSGFDPKLLVGAPLGSAFPERPTPTATPREIGTPPPKRTPAAAPRAPTPPKPSPKFNFATEAEAEAAEAAGTLKKGDRITIAGRSGTWQ